MLQHESYQQYDILFKFIFSLLRMRSHSIVDLTVAFNLPLSIM